MRRALVGLVIVVLGLLLAFVNRRFVLLWIGALLITPPGLSDRGDEGQGVSWFDDYYTIELIDPQTIAIGEPRYYQQNFNYLILGEERAVLFDSGPGVRDIRPVVASLTDLPVVAVPSHLHYDHIGNHTRFDQLAMVDLPYLRARAPEGLLRPTRGEHVGFFEGIERPELRVTEWWAPGAAIDLGGRSLEVLHTPGHTPESISLLDRAHGLLFTGDYLHEGPVIAFLPGSSLADYAETAQRLEAQLDGELTLLTAHRTTSPGAPMLALQDLRDLGALLAEIRAGSAEGSGFFPQVFHVNDRVSIVTDFPWADR